MTQTELDCLKLDKANVRLKKRLEEIDNKIEELLNQPKMTEKKKKLALEWREKGYKNSSLISDIFPNCYLSYKVKYWGIKNLYIVPYNKLIEEWLDVRKTISYNEGMIIALKKDMTKEQLDEYIKNRDTHVKVVISYDIDPGDCGDCY